jgi:hypothetical protein
MYDKTRHATDNNITLRMRLRGG